MLCTSCGEATLVLSSHWCSAHTDSAYTTGQLTLLLSSTSVTSRLHLAQSLVMHTFFSSNSDDVTVCPSTTAPTVAAQHSRCTPPLSSLIYALSSLTLCVVPLPPFPCFFSHHVLCPCHPSPIFSHIMSRPLPPFPHLFSHLVSCTCHVLTALAAVHAWSSTAVE